MTPDGRERFFAAIAERIPPERIAEVHLFPPMRQGGRETGVAVITVVLDVDPPADDATGALGDDADVDAAAATGELDPPHEDDERLASAGLDEALGIDPALDPFADDATDAADEAEPPAPAARPPRRFTIFRASYRLTLKGPDRGKWEVMVTEEGDAPGYTVDEVVRGVHERAGGDDEPEHLTGETFRAALAGEPWPARR